MAASVAGVSLACALATPAFAQETTSTIHGSVTSESGPVAGATVEILNTSTGGRSTTTTTASGDFDASGLRAGDSYTVTVTAPGYPSSQVTDIVTLAAQVFDAEHEGVVLVLTQRAGRTREGANEADLQRLGLRLRGPAGSGHDAGEGEGFRCKELHGWLPSDEGG